MILELIESFFIWSMLLYNTHVLRVQKTGFEQLAFLCFYFIAEVAIKISLTKSGLQKENELRVATEWEIESKEAAKRLNTNKRKCWKSKTKRKGDKNEQIKTKEIKWLRKWSPVKKDCGLRIFCTTMCSAMSTTVFAHFNNCSGSSSTIKLTLIYPMLLPLFSCIWYLCWWCTVLPAFFRFAGQYKFQPQWNSWKKFAAKNPFSSEESCKNNIKTINLHRKLPKPEKVYS